MKNWKNKRVATWLQHLYGKWFGPGRRKWRRAIGARLQIEQLETRLTPALLSFSQVYAVGTFPASVAVADFNGDGKLDLATANFVSGNVSVLLGNGNGTSRPKHSPRGHRRSH